MASVNKVILIGNLGADPEVRYLPSGEAVVNLSVATTDKFKDKRGEVQEATEWHRVSFFGRTAEVCVEDIAALVHKTPRTVREDLRRRPETLPPVLRIPGSLKKDKGQQK